MHLRVFIHMQTYEGRERAFNIFEQYDLITVLRRNVGGTV